MGRLERVLKFSQRNGKVGNAKTYQGFYLEYYSCKTENNYGL